MKINKVENKDENFQPFIYALYNMNFIEESPIFDDLEKYDFPLLKNF